MSRVTRFNAAIAALATAALVGCSDTMVQPTGQLRAPSAAPGRLITPVLSGVVVGNGSFANAIQTTEANRNTAGVAFYGNPSSDDGDTGGNPWPNANKCNIGYFAAGTLGPTCNFTAFGSTPGGYANYYGNGTGNLGSPSFMFGGQYSYDVKLVGSYSFGFSEVGYFTINAGVYTLHPVPAWGTLKQIGAAVSFSTGGDNWGFYAKNPNFTSAWTCGALTSVTCSDATGGFAGQPFQQHSLFVNSTGDQFLVGLEDNVLGLWAGDCPSALHPSCSPANPTNQDSDYNDYIFNIVPHIIPSGGCTFTKGWYRNHGSNTVIAVDGRTQAQAQAIFDATPGKPGNVTFGGNNSLLNLYQQLMAAILNGGTGGPAATQAAIIAAQNGTGGTGLNITTTLTKQQISDLTSALDNFNSGNLAGFPHCGDTN